MSEKEIERKELEDRKRELEIDKGDIEIFCVLSALVVVESEDWRADGMVGWLSS